MDQAPDRPSVAPDVDQEWRRDLVRVPRIVPVVLVVSLDLAGIRVKGDDGARVEIVAGVHVARPGRRIAGPPVRQVEVGIVESREPDRRSTGLPGVPRPGVVARLTGHYDPDLNLTYWGDRKSTRLNSSHSQISYAVFCLKKKSH